MAYEYRGDIHDAAEPLPEVIATPGIFNADKCGTSAGHKQHLDLDVPVCPDCREAIADYWREYRARRRAGASRVAFNPDKCGTYAGYHRHLRSDVAPCAACSVANSDYMHKLRAAKRAA